MNGSAREEEHNNWFFIAKWLVIKPYMLWTQHYMDLKVIYIYCCQRGREFNRKGITVLRGFGRKEKRHKFIIKLQCQKSVYWKLI